MREVVFGTILVAAAGAGVYFMPVGALGGGPAYPLTVKEAKLLLAHADLREGKEPFGRLEVQVTSPQTDVVRYAAGGSFATIDCRAKLVPVGDKGIDVETSCDRAAASDGAAASTAKDITEIAFAEYVASILGKRPYDDAKVSGASAGAVFKNLGSMQKDALKMDRDMHKAIAEGNAGSADDTADDSAGDYSEPDTVADSGGE